MEGEIIVIIITIIVVVVVLVVALVLVVVLVYVESIFWLYGAMLGRFWVYVVLVN